MEGEELTQGVTVASISEGERPGLARLRARCLCWAMLTGPVLAELAAEAKELPEVLQSTDPALLADHLASLFSFGEGDLQLGCVHLFFSCNCVVQPLSRSPPESGDPMQAQNHSL